MHVYYGQDRVTRFATEGLWLWLLRRGILGELAGNHKVVFLFSCFVAVAFALSGSPCCEVHTRQKVNAASELNDKDLTLPVSVFVSLSPCPCVPALYCIHTEHAACLVAATLLPMRVCMFGCLMTPKLWHAMPDQARYSTQHQAEARPDQAEANNNGFRFQNKRRRWHWP